MKQKKENIQDSKNEKKFPKNKKKIFIFCFDVMRDKVTHTFLSNKVRNLLKRHDDEIIYIFVTKFSLIPTLKVLNKTIKPKTGYIISNNGACLYDISTKKILFKNSLSKEVKLSLIHEAILKSLLIVSPSGTKCSSYFTNIFEYKKFMNDFNIANKPINNYLTFWHYIYENDFLSFVFYESNGEILLKKYRIFKSLEKDLNINFSKIENNMFSVSNGDTSIEKTYIKLLVLLNDKINIKKTHCFVLNSFNEFLWNIFSKNHYINVLHLISNRNSIKTHIVPQDMFLPENIDKIISVAINNTGVNKKHSITSVKKEFINLQGKNQ